MRVTFDSFHKIIRSGGKFHILIGVTGSVASIKINELIEELYRICPKDKIVIKVIFISFF